MLQTTFDSPDSAYGAHLDWRGYTVYDAANIMRRYLCHLPEPVITLSAQKAFSQAIGKAKE